MVSRKGRICYNPVHVDTKYHRNKSLTAIFFDDLQHSASDDRMMGKISHLNCTPLHPAGIRMLNGTGGFFNRSHWVNHCLLVETSDGLVLVDSGFGCRDITHPSGIVRTILWAFGSNRNVTETALYQIQDLGYAASDIRHIVLTHLHPDHTGGISDFPEAKIHVSKREYDDAHSPHTLQARTGYAGHQWSHQPEWITHIPEPATWYGFASIPVVDKLSPAILLIKLPGHTPGHCGVAIETGEGWMLHCGDAFSYHGEVGIANHEKRHSAGFFQTVSEADRTTRLDTVTRLRNLTDQYRKEIMLINSHDSFFLK